MYHAEIVALRVGEPYGTLVLALAVTIIEAGLIISIMAPGPYYSPLQLAFVCSSHPWFRRPRLKLKVLAETERSYCMDSPAYASSSAPFANGNPSSKWKGPRLSSRC
jgi:hypothetical protein